MKLGIFLTSVGGSSGGKNLSSWLTEISTEIAKWGTGILFIVISVLIYQYMNTTKNGDSSGSQTKKTQIVSVLFLAIFLAVLRRFIS